MGIPALEVGLYHASQSDRSPYLAVGARGGAEEGIEHPLLQATCFFEAVSL